MNMNRRERRRMLEGRDQQERAAEIAECECGAQVRQRGSEWVHQGECRIGKVSSGSALPERYC